jgi:hypothetical protein
MPGAASQRDTWSFDSLCFAKSFGSPLLNEDLKGLSDPDQREDYLLKTMTAYKTGTVTG